MENGRWNRVPIRGIARLYHLPSSIYHPRASVPEVTLARKDHGDALFISGGNHFGIAHGATGLYDRRGARLREDVETVTEGKEGIRRGGGSLELVDAGLRHCDLHRIDAAHLPRSDRERAIAGREHDRVRLHVRA